MTTYDHVHAFVHLRMPVLAGILTLLHLPIGWLVVTGELPHHPDCTPTMGVLEQ